MRRLRPWMIAALLMLCASVAQAFDVGPRTPLVFTDPQGTRVLVDPQGTLNATQAMARAAEFRPAAGLGKLNLSHTYWTLNTLVNRLGTDREIRIDIASWARVDAWVLQEGRPPQPLQPVGAFRPSYGALTWTNPYQAGIGEADSQFAVFTLPRDAEVRVLTRLRASYNLAPAGVVPTFHDHARYLELRRFGLELEGVMVGILLTVGVFGWYSAMRNRDRTSVLYAVWILFALLSANAQRVHDGARLFEFALDARDVTFAGADLSWLLIVSLAYGQTIGYVMFARSFLDLRSHMRTVYRITNVYAALTIAHLVLVCFTDHQLPNTLVWGPLAMMIVAMLLTLFGCAYQRYRQGLKVAKFFMFAMVPYLFFRLLFMLGVLLQVPSPFNLMESKGIGLFMQHPGTAQAVGVCCEALIMGLAVFAKNRWLQDELKEKMQAQAELVKNQNEVLEATVAERTRELVESKADTERQHQLLVDSIAYASRLQRAQLPRAQRLDGHVGSWHALWEPRDTIGGDVWWVSAPDATGRVTVVLADSTGHGVPGAMLSVLISTSLERMFATRPDLDPATALSLLDRALRAGLNQSGADAQSDDGCDAAAVRIDPHARCIEFAGAKLGLLHLRSAGEAERIQPTRVSLGYRQPPAQEPELQRIDCSAGDVLLLVTDGVTDQVGGDGTPRAYGYKRLAALLQRCAGQDAPAIAAALRHDLSLWQGSQMRRDDATAVVLQLA